MRQISLFNTAATRQMHILTTRRDLPAAEIRYRMGSRWRQENHYRYARIHFDLDSHDTYRAADDDPTRMVPNPAKKPAYRDVEKARRALHSAETTSDAALLAAHSPQPGTSVVLTNQMINTINTEVHTAQTALDAALATHQAIPARLPLAAGQPRPAGPGHRDQTDPPRHPHRRVQHRTIARPRDRHRHRLHPRRRRSPHPDPHRTGRIRRHHPRPRHPAHPARPAARTTAHRRHRRTLPRPQRHQHRLPRHRPDPALQHQIPPMTAHQFLSYVRSPGYRDWLDNARRLRELTTELETLTIHAVEHAEGWGS